MDQHPQCFGVPTAAREPALVFDHEGHRFVCVLDFHVYEDVFDRSLCEEARWRVSIDGRHVTDYPAYVGERPEHIKTRLLRVHDAQMELGIWCWPT